jgi:hypothetical protein
MDDIQFRKQLFRALKDEPLRPDDARYVDFYSGHPEDPVRRLAEQIEFLEVESFQMFSGFRGSGKTTELNRLGNRLRDNGMVVLYGDALQYVNSAAPLDIVTLLFSITGSFNDALQEKGYADQLHEGYWERFTNFLTRTNVDLEKMGLKVGGEVAAADFKFNLRQTPTFRQRLAEKIAGSLKELSDEVYRFFADALEVIRRKDGPDTRVVFLFDQLEQIRGSGLEQEAVIRSVEAIFANHIDLLRVPSFHVVYTVPPWLKTMLPGLTIETLPALGVWKNDDDRTRNIDHCNALRDVVIKRFDHKNFERFFGCIEANGECVLADRLVESSGGSLRDLLRLNGEAVLSAITIPADETAIQRAITKVRSQFLPIPLSDAKWLSRVALTRSDALTDRTPQQVARFSLFLDTHLVFQLRNGTEWYDVHPLIREETNEIVRRAALVDR